MKVKNGAIYMTKNRGPRTEPWRTPQMQVCGEENRYCIGKKNGRNEVPSVQATEDSKVYG